MSLFYLNILGSMFMLCYSIIHNIYIHFKEVSISKKFIDSSIIDFEAEFHHGGLGNNGERCCCVLLKMLQI